MTWRRLHLVRALAASGLVSSLVILGSPLATAQAVDASDPSTLPSGAETETVDLLKALPLDLLLAAMLASVTGLISSMALRRGFAVVGSILAVLVSNSAISTVQVIASESGADLVGEIAGLLSPWSLVNALASAMDAGIEVYTPADGALMTATYVVVALLTVIVPGVALIKRFEKAGR